MGINEVIRTIHKDIENVAGYELPNGLVKIYLTILDGTHVGE